MTIWIFYGFVFIIIATSLLIIFTRNLMHAVFSTMLVFLGIAGLYVLMQAEFIAATQIMVYVGGVLVLLIFGVMLTTRTGVERSISVSLRSAGLVGLLVTALLGFFCWAILQTDFSTLPHLVESPPSTATTTQVLGIRLMTDYLLPLEITAILLLVALIGAAVIATHKK
ncbi:MAG: NADH-quinone oxidoreductase subunit J [Bacteroidota bacterium]